MAGLSCADGLRETGHDVTLFDKGRGPGGRMSTRRIETPLGVAAFDHGAQYFTARDPGFRRQTEIWHAQGHVAPWPLAAPDAWVGTPAMNAVIKAMASSHDVRWNTRIEQIEREPRGWLLHAADADAEFAGFDAIVLAIPAEQALPFLSLHDFAMAREAMLARSQPCWTAMFAFSEPLGSGKDMIRDIGILGWAARNAAKPGRTGPEGWVVQARPEWSQAHVEDDAGQVAARLLTELGQVLGIEVPVPLVATAHRWRYAMSAGLGIGAMWNASTRLGLCADWLLGPRVECAWLSGRQLARAVLEETPNGALIELRARQCGA